MRKGLVTLGVVALVLAVSPGFSEAPIMTCLPDIVISDVESHTQTADANLFVFSDALNFDSLAEDADTSDSVLRWSGIDTAAMISINGIALNDPLVDTLEPGAQDLRAAGQMATFVNDVWNATPPTGSGVTTETIITLYVSDGTTVTEGTMKVTTVNTEFGDLGPTDAVVPVTLASFDFAGGAQGWTWFAVPVAGITEAGHAATGGALTMTESLPHSEVVFGGWESPKDPAAAVSPKLGCIIRARYQISTDAASPQATPGMRMRGATVHVTNAGGTWEPDFTSEDYTSLDEMKFGTIDFKMIGGEFDGRTPGAGQEYALMLFPRQVADNLESDDPVSPVIHYFSCDLMDLEGSIENDAGTLTIDSVVIDGIDRPEIGEGTAVAGLSFTDFSSGWTTGVKNLPPGTLNQAGLVVSAGADLSITIAPGNANFEAFVEHGTGGTLIPGQYYRLAWWCTSTETPGGDAGATIRTDLGSEDFVWNVSKELQGGALLARLTSTPSLMEVWLVAPTAKTSTPGATENMKPKMYSYLGANVASWPFFRLVSGTIACTTLETEEFDPF